MRRIIGNLKRAGDQPHEDIYTKNNDEKPKHSLVFRDAPHPFSNRESLQGQVLRILKDEITQVKDGAKPDGDTIRFAYDAFI